MLKILKPTLLVICFCITSLCQIFAEDNVSDNETIVEIRQQTMQAIWQRLDRLSALIARPGDVIASSDGNSIVIGNKETQSTETYALIHGREAIQDASEISNFLKQVKDFWPDNTSDAHIKHTSAETLVWLIPDAFKRYYTDAVIASENLELSLSSEDDEKIRRSVCMLALSCGRCHAAFRKVRYSNLRKEGRGWTGSYESCWRYKNEITLDSTSIRK